MIYVNPVTNLSKTIETQIIFTIKFMVYNKKVEKR